MIKKKMFNTRVRVGKILSYIVKKSQGITNVAQTVLENGIYNYIGKGLLQNPYMGKVKLPMYPLSREFLKKHGVRPDVLISVSKANRYLEYQYKKLQKAKEENNSMRYGSIHQRLMKRSVAYQIAFANRMNKGGYFNKPFEQMIGILNSIPKLVNKHKVITYRVYIPKEDGTLRPIGSPRKDWNTVLGMGAGALTDGTKDRIHGQHGFLPSKGLGTAGLEIITVVVKAKNIMEYDLKKAFNSIPLYAQDGVESNKWGTYDHYNTAPEANLQNALRHMEIPEYIIDKLLIMNSENQVKYDRRKPYDKYDPELVLKGAIKDKKMDDFEVNYEDGSYTEKETGKVILEPYYYGLTQGAPTSPILMNIFSEYGSYLASTPEISELKYADDGIGYTDTELPPEAMEEIMKYKEGRTKGIKFNRKKSAVVKFNGVPVKERLQFLGTSINLITNSLEGRINTTPNAKPTKGFLEGLKPYADADWNYNIPVGHIKPEYLVYLVGRTYNLSVNDTGRGEIAPYSLIDLYNKLMNKIESYITPKDIRIKTFSTLANGLLLKCLTRHSGEGRKLMPKGAGDVAMRRFEKKGHVSRLQNFKHLSR